MPARRQASSGKKSTGRQKRTVGKASGSKTTEERLPTASEIRDKTPPPKSKLSQRDSLTERRKRKSGVADSAITTPKPKARKTTPKKKTADNKGKSTARSGQKPAVRKRAAAARPTQARKPNTGGKQARTTGRTKNTSSNRSG